jgi:hypothetical protein
MFASDAGETPMLETRLLTFGPQGEDNAAQAEAAGADANG